MTDLDRIDFELIALLQKDGRISNKELAAHVDLAPSTCHERVKKLWQAGVLRGVHADVTPEALGVGLQAMVAVRMTQHSRPMVEALHRYLLALDEVLAVYHLAGRQDFMVHVAVRDTEHLRDLTMDAFTTRHEVDHIETSIIYAFDRAHTLPNLSEP